MSKDKDDTQQEARTAVIDAIVSVLNYQGAVEQPWPPIDIARRKAEAIVFALTDAGYHIVDTDELARRQTLCGPEHETIDKLREERRLLLALQEAVGYLPYDIGPDDIEAHERVQAAYRASVAGIEPEKR